MTYIRPFLVLLFAISANATPVIDSIAPRSFYRAGGRALPDNLRVESRSRSSCARSAAVTVRVPARRERQGEFAGEPTAAIEAAVGPAL